MVGKLPSTVHPSTHGWQDEPQDRFDGIDRPDNRVHACVLVFERDLPSDEDNQHA